MTAAVMKVLLATLFVFSLSGLSFLRASDDSKKKGKPDLTGVWVLDITKSDPPGRGEQNVTDYVLTIIQKEPEIKMIARFKQGGREHETQTIYYTDGRPEMNSAVIGASQHFTGWRGSKLVSSITVRHQLNGIIADETVTTVEWELSVDDATLTRTTKSTTRTDDRKAKAVFKRSS